MWRANMQQAVSSFERSLRTNFAEQRQNKIFVYEANVCVYTLRYTYVSPACVLQPCVLCDN